MEIITPFDQIGIWQQENVANPKQNLQIKKFFISLYLNFKTAHNTKYIFLITTKLNQVILDTSFHIFKV